MTEEALYQISRSIVSEIGPMLTSRPYIALIDKFGKIQYMDESVEKYRDFMSSFVQRNFSFLRIGDHSIPISGLNMVFFKLSNKIVLVMFMKQGLVGQLLAFKNKMGKFASEIDQHITLVPPEGLEEGADVDKVAKEEVIEEEIPEEEEEVKVIPQLVKKIRKKDKSGSACSVSV